MWKSCDKFYRILESEDMRKKGQNIFIAVCSAPALLIFGMFVIYPMLEAFKVGFYRWSGLSAGSAVFIGIDNFKMLLNDSIVWIALKNNIFLMAVVPAVTMTISLFFAVILTRRDLPEKNFYRTVFFFPNVLSVVVISILWMFIYNPTFGILNSMLGTLGLEDFTRTWLGDSATVMGSLAVTMVWSWVGFYMVLYMAGIENIPIQLYEAAIIDGAGEFQQFTKITFPLIWEIMRVTIIFFIINVFNGSFIYVNVMTNGGPDNASQVLSNYMYSQAFKNSNLGYATANAILIFIIVSVLSIISNRFTQKETVEF